MSLSAFNRVLARHIALAFNAGDACDEDLIERCYAEAGREITLPDRGSSDPLAMEVRAMCMAHDLKALRQNEAHLRKMSFAKAETEIFRLLNPDLRVTGVGSNDPLHWRR